MTTAAGCPWEQAAEALRKLSAHSVVCLDEFEALLYPAFDDRFFNALMSWQNEGLLSWVTASAQPLEALGKLHGHTSPFFNLLATVPLVGLTPAEAGQLLALADPTPSVSPQKNSVFSNTWPEPSLTTCKWPPGSCGK